MGNTMTDTLLERLQNGQKLQRLADDRAIADGLDTAIKRLWPKFDTVEIARYAKVDESKVANRLAQLRDNGAL